MSGLLLGPGTVWASEDKNIVKIGSDVTIESGMKVRNVVTIGGQITVDGTVDNNVVAVGGSVVLTKKAVVGGNVLSLGGVIVSARDAQVSGSLTEINSSNLYETLTAAMSAEWEGWSWIFAVISLAIFLVILVVALLIVALLPKPVRIVGEAIRENTFKVVLCGLLGLVLIAPLALLLTISVVGIALIPLEVIIVVASVLLGFIAVGQLIGGKVLHLFKRPNPGDGPRNLLGVDRPVAHRLDPVHRLDGQGRRHRPRPGSRPDHALRDPPGLEVHASRPRCHRPRMPTVPG